MHRLTHQYALLAGVLASLLAAGCAPGDDFLDDLEDIDITIGQDNTAAGRVRAAVPVIQTRDPRQLALPPALQQQGDTVIINQNVQVIQNVDQQLVPAEVPNITLLAFENLTGNDMYIRYLADGEPQGVLVFAGEGLLLEYPCLTSIELLREEDFDPFSQELIAEYQLDVFVGPDEFACGEAVVFEIDEFGVGVFPEYIDLR